MASRSARRELPLRERSTAYVRWASRVSAWLNLFVLSLFFGALPLAVVGVTLLSGGAFLREPTGWLTLALLIAYYRWGLPLAYPGLRCARASILILLDPRAEPGERADFLPTVEEADLHRRFGTRAIRVARLLERYPEASCFVLHPDADTYLKERLSQVPLVDRLRGVHVIRLGGPVERWTVGVEFLRLRLRLL